MPLQTSPSPISVLGTVGLLAIFLSLTAHLAARNVIGDVAPLKALGVGVGPAILSLATQLLSIPAGIGVAAALLVDGVAIHFLYGESPRTSAYITAIHAIITIILGAVLTGVVALFVSAPG
ncbi:hypothetical protein EGH24_03235 [Halonotius terrestris]|uniref:Uncharacterized protein n=1 Tax=Halonotius terrestris TaxID=2487750 RepID=A0A8J8PEY6_9EURY|nr:hypothetical protein EGH24_03235 [Halonotius terrestris]